MQDELTNAVRKSAGSKFAAAKVQARIMHSWCVPTMAAADSSGGG